MFPPSTDDTRKKESKGKRAELASNVQAMGYVAVWQYSHIHTEEVNYGGSTYSSVRALRGGRYRYTYEATNDTAGQVLLALVHC